MLGMDVGGQSLEVRTPNVESHLSNLHPGRREPFLFALPLTGDMTYPRSCQELEMDLDGPKSPSAHYSHHKTILPPTCPNWGPNKGASFISLVPLSIPVPTFSYY